MTTPDRRDTAPGMGDPTRSDDIDSPGLRSDGAGSGAIADTGGGRDAVRRRRAVTRRRSRADPDPGRSGPLGGQLGSCGWRLRIRQRRRDRLPRQPRRRGRPGRERTRPADRVAPVRGRRGRPGDGPMTGDRAPGGTPSERRHHGAVDDPAHAEFATVEHRDLPQPADLVGSAERALVVDDHASQTAGPGAATQAELGGRPPVPGSTDADDRATAHDRPMPSLVHLTLPRRRMARRRTRRWRPSRDAISGRRATLRPADRVRPVGRATQTVFGEGPAHAPLFLVGEQPGDREDIEGHPFVGPAGSCWVVRSTTRDPTRGRVREQRRQALQVEAQGQAAPPRAPERLGDPRVSAVARPRARSRPARRPRAAGGTAANAVLGPRFRLTEQRGTLLAGWRWRSAADCDVPPVRGPAGTGRGSAAHDL